MIIQPSSRLPQVAPAARAASTPEVRDRVQLGSTAPEPDGRPIPGSFIGVIDRRDLAQVTSDPALPGTRVLGTAGDVTFVLLEGSGWSAEAVRERAPFLHLAPNYEYSGDVLDLPVAEPVLSGAEEPPVPARPGHLDLIQIDPAWEKTKGNPAVLAAVTDTGLDMGHPALQGSVWQNPGEIAGNGQDDEGNGFVDDVHGWDFTSGDNDPRDTQSSHHTHVHGILFAREGGQGVAGVAPEAQGMALRITGGERPFSSALMVETYLYALNQGARSINTSFNIDRFVGDEALGATYRTLADHDVLLFNSAGNSGQKDPRRGAFEDIVLVASTDTSPERRDRRSEFSNYGAAIDVAAPGRDILSTLPGGRVGRLSGTSMATPVAMGVDMLIQSAHPDWNAAQRWAQLAGTADRIDGLNPGEEGLLGAGRVNAGRALTETLPPPTLSAREVREPIGDLSRVVVHFDRVLDPASANQAEAWSILDGEGRTVAQGAPKEVRLMTNELSFDVGGLPDGSYRLVGSAGHLKDPFGQALDGNSDGVPGDDFVQAFEIARHRVL